jgi:hypothetical protein
MCQKKSKRKNARAMGMILATVAGSGFAAHAQSDPAVDKLTKENQQLRQRLDALEDAMKKEGVMASGESSKSPITAMSSTTLSGFVTASYFYDVASSKDSHPTGYLWNTGMNQFTLNKVKVTLASPPPDKDKWDASYRVSLMYGEDANITDPHSNIAGYAPIREAFVDFNIPIGTGLDVKAGELISLLNYESGDGGAVNANFSQGYQWYYTGNPPGGAVQLSYDFNDMIGLKARIQNGLYAGEIGTSSKTFLGGLYITPDKKTSLAFLGFAGHQDATASDLSGGSFIGSRQLMESHNLTFATEFDWFHYTSFNPANVSGTDLGHSAGDFGSLGGWLTADICPRVTAALRGEIIRDPTGYGTVWNSPSPEGGYGSAFANSLYTSGVGQSLTSATFTLDIKPAPALKLQPEVRWNHSTTEGAFSGKKDQLIVGMGASYLF